MLDAKTGPQQYKLFEHEVKLIVNAAKNPAFTLRAMNGKMITGTKDSIMGRDLLLTLQSSEKAKELMETTAYDFTLKRDYTLHIALAETADQ